MSVQEWTGLQGNVEQTLEEKQQEFKIEQSRRKKARTTKKPLVIAGNETIATPYAGPVSELFEGLTFYIMTDQLHPVKRGKAELEALVKANGGKVVQRDTPDKTLVVIADKRLIKVVSLEKRNTNNIIKPIWLSDCIAQKEADVGALPYLLPFEPNRHMFYLHDDDLDVVEGHIDSNGDSYARDIVDVEEMRKLLEGMQKPGTKKSFDKQGFLNQLQGHGEEVTRLKSYMFVNSKVAIQDNNDLAWAQKARLVANYVRFGGGEVAERNSAKGVTHIIVPDGGEVDSSSVTNMARAVGIGWVERCWEEGTMLDEEKFQWG